MRKSGRGKKIQTRSRAVEARNVWRRRGGRCVRDKDRRSPLASGRASTRFCSSGKKKKVNESGGRRQARSGGEGRGLLVWWRSRGEGIRWRGRSRYSSLWSGTQAGVELQLDCGCGWRREVPRVFSAVDGGHWSGLLSVRGSVSSAPLARFPCCRSRSGVVRESDGSTRLGTSAAWRYGGHSRVRASTSYVVLWHV
jgi:hypothetical protein